MYIQLDGQILGTGLYYLNGIPIDRDSLCLSSETISWLDSWLKKYWKAKYSGFKQYKRELNERQLIDLDFEGLELKRVIEREIQNNNPDCFITYWSEALGEHLNDDGGIIYHWEDMVSSNSI